MTSPADSRTQNKVPSISASRPVQANSPVAQPAPKKIPFHVECVNMENQPFPDAHVLRLKNRDGMTKSRLPNERLSTAKTSVLRRWIAAHTAPVTRTEYVFPKM